MQGILHSVGVSRCTRGRALTDYRGRSARGSSTTAGAAVARGHSCTPIGLTPLRIPQSAPPAGYPDAEFWVDYFAWGYPDGSSLSDWGDPVRDKGACTAVAPTVLTDTSKNWTPGEFADEWLVVGPPREYRILTNTSSTITIAAGDMVADGVVAGDYYRVCRDELTQLPPLDVDQPNAGNRIVNSQFDDDAAETAQPTG